MGVLNRGWAPPVQTSLALLLVLGCLVGEAQGQISPEFLTVSVRPVGPFTICATVPAFCSGETHSANLGRHEFALRTNTLDYPSDSVVCVLDWPADWVLESVQFCGGTLVGGVPLQRKSHLKLATDCEDARPLCRLMFDCRAPGILSVFGSVHLCQGNWEGGPSDLHASVGTYCGQPVDYDCGFCDHYTAATFSESALELVSSGTLGASRVVSVYGFDFCPIPAECGGSSQTPCFTGLGVDVPWLHLNHLGGDFYRIIAQPTGLAPGTYLGHVSTLPSQCGYCEPSCLDVTFVVLASPTSVEEPEAIDAQIIGPYPNPVSDLVHYTLELTRSEAVEVRIVDVTGRTRATLLHAELDAGSHDLSAAPAQATGGRLPSGVYFLSLKVGPERSSRMFVLR